ncbi:hypothetical protein [Flavobacterium aquicola]|uniref:Uncharacterized protein n=1 Tax=Flavobacterium aquicola TaxID=1682742 RepID=A0A3E0EWY8_9FLAO|nr:hypothetical protein [Flavobacterium aquicola]REH01677.1 hypothetical protein C8P67_101157 [Flavobacterium aquicola]
MKKLLLVIAMTQLMVSCSDDTSETKKEEETNSGKYYVVGSKYDRNSENNYSWLAAIWVDGVPTVLSNEGLSEANAVAIYNNDIYVAGTQSLSNGNDVLKLWKNNAAESLTDGKYRVEARDLAVSEGNVYIAGNEYKGSLNTSIATVWKNGQAIHLSDEISEVNAICLYNNDVYAAGYKEIDGKKTAIIWKIGKEETILYSGDDDFESIATDIYVDDKGVFASGNIRNSTKSTAMLWKNTIGTALSDVENYSQANALFVNGSDVYVCGTDINTRVYTFIGKVWKNGNLIKEISGYNSLNINIADNKIYIASFGLDGNDINSEHKVFESGLDNLNFTEKYKFTNDKINAVLVK